MIQKLQHKFALSYQGAIDMIKACISVSFSNIALMLPSALIVRLIGDLLSGSLGAGALPFYVVGTVIVLALIALTQYIQYN